jgi:hypothetical protein
LVLADIVTEGGTEVNKEMVIFLFSFKHRVLGLAACGYAFMKKENNPKGLRVRPREKIK